MTKQTPLEFNYGDTLPARLQSLSSEIQKAVGENLANAGVGLNDWRVLAEVANGATTAREIVSATGVDKGWVSRSIAALTDLGLLTSAPSPTDSRAKILTITEPGIERYNEMARTMRDLQNRLLDAFSADEHAAFMRLIERLRREAGRIVRP
ncbi:MAG: MarR family winged helix-turn-helix transcriptional regulator [Alphaproteobacteria bacterium]|nr:MarR family winged helix-turn-helix transcriptional regulator [Alphaproteobacteria bacterium]